MSTHKSPCAPTGDAPCYTTNNANASIAPAAASAIAAKSAHTSPCIATGDAPCYTTANANASLAPAAAVTVGATSDATW